MYVCMLLLLLLPELHPEYIRLLLSQKIHGFHVIC